ncbi:MAG TPA: SpoIIE family protein phosphatase [bacterium]|nr:SpoIIE family protein phosphatase [bacterium]
MPWFDEKSRRFRAVITALFLVLFSVSVLNFYYMIGSPTDENWFTNTPAPFYLVRDIPSTLLKIESRSRFAVETQRVADSLLTGDILLPASKGTGFEAFSDSLQRLRGLDTLLTLAVYRPAFNQVYRYQLASRLLPDTLLRLLPPTVAVFSVARGGASDRAGMKAGDLILSINNQTFRDMHEADGIMRSGRSGKSIVYEVLRRNETLRLNVTLARLGIPFSQLIFVLAGCTYMALGLFLGLSRPQIKAARLLALGFTLLGYVLMLLNTGQDLAPGFLAVLFKYPLPAMAFFSIALLMHSTYYFPRPSPLLLARRWPVILPYAAALICTLLVYISGDSRFFNLLTLALIGLSILPLFLFRKQVNSENKRLSRIIRLALLVTLVLTIALGWYVNRYASPMSAGIIALPLILIPAAYLYTIGRYRLFDLNLRIRRNIRYSILVTIWIMILTIIGIAIFWRLPALPIQLPHITLTGSSIEVVDTPQNQQEQATLVKGLLMVLAVVSVFSLWKIGKLGTRFLARQFHRDQYDYRRASQLLNEVMSRQTGLAELAEEVVERVNNLMHLRQIGVLFFRETHEIACGKAAGLPEERWNEFMDEAPALAAKLAAWLPDEERFTIDYLPEKLKKRFFEFGFRYLMPILTQERLRGLFLLGEKNSETPFYQEDYQFLRSIGQPVSVAIEKALLYEELAQRERLRHEMEIARRIQLASLPQETPHMPGLEIAGLSIPALEVGGDYYEYLNGCSECITIVVGDVSGKGISAALYMSKVQGIIRSLHSFHLGPRELCVHLNRLLGRDLEKNYFVTALAAEIRTAERRLVLTRAGHLPLYHYRTRTRSVDSLTPRGIGFALREEEHFAQELEEMQVGYEAGDIFLFATDGVTETRNTRGEEFGEVKLQRLLAGHAEMAAAQLCDALLQELRHFSGTALQADDLTVVVVKAV